MMRVGGFVVLNKAEYERMLDQLERCNTACPILTRLKEAEPAAAPNSSQKSDEHL